MQRAAATENIATAVLQSLSAPPVIDASSAEKDDTSSAEIDASSAATDEESEATDSPPLSRISEVTTSEDAEDEADD